MIKETQASTQKPKGYYSNPRSEMIPFIPVSSKKILDAGCGEGAFASAVKLHLKAETWGLELDSVSAEKAKEKLDKVIQGDLSVTIQLLPDHSFDCIIFNDVLEHLVDPFTTLHLIQKKLSPQGKLVCSIPNIRYWRAFRSYVFGKQWRYTEDGIMDRTHLRFFTKKSICDMFLNAGYRITTIKGLNPTPSILFNIMNALLLFQLNDCRYTQFAVVAEL